MKIRNPINRDDLKINRKDWVLEVGSGHNPMRRSNVIVEKYVNDNYHRSDDVKVYLHQEFVNANAECMPFKEKEFDYVICNQVLEHAEDPTRFVNELQRVACRGYLELPSLVGESLFPKASHKWVCLEIDKKLILYQKSKLPEFFPNFGTTFLNHLPYKCLALRIFYYSYHQAHVVRYEWKNEIEIITDPEEDKYKDYFTKAWTDEMRDAIFPSRTKLEDIRISLKVIFHLIGTALKKKFSTGEAASLEEYYKAKGNNENKL